MPRVAAAALSVFVIGTGCGNSSPTPAVATDPLADPTPIVSISCDPVTFDEKALLGDEFDGDSYPDGYTSAVTQEFLDGLAGVYDHPEAANVCRLFTDEGWHAALAADWRLRDAAQGELRFDLDHVVRLVYESEYDHASRPPRFEVDAIYDIAPGARTHRADTNAVVGTSIDAERLGFHLSFAFDGRLWRVEDVGPVSPDNATWLVLRTKPSGVAGPCSGFVRDAPQSAFDDDANRRWCDGDGRGVLLQFGEQYTLLTRYPCDTGHAAILGIGDPIGRPVDPLVRREFVRDPLGEFLQQGWVDAPFDGAATLPADAVYTGWTNGNVELWIAPGERNSAIYVRRGDLVERWPRAVDPWGVIDCN
jgi:hypothetical protein